MLRRQLPISNPTRLAALSVLAFLLAFSIYIAWIKNADLRTAAQMDASAGVPTCMDLYGNTQDSTLSRLQIIWSASALCYNLASTRLRSEEQIIRNENLVFQRYENTIIMFMVVVITLSGVVLAGLQLLASYRLASMGKGDLSNGGELSLSPHSMAVKSSVVGVVILGISFAFFLVFVLYVYTFTPAEGGASSQAAANNPIDQAGVAEMAAAQSVQNAGRGRKKQMPADLPRNGAAPVANIPP